MPGDAILSYTDSIGVASPTPRRVTGRLTRGAEKEWGPARRSGTVDRKDGPLAHRVEQGTFNPKVRGSRPRRPTKRRPSMHVDGPQKK